MRTVLLDKQPAAIVNAPKHTARMNLPRNVAHLDYFAAISQKLFELAHEGSQIMLLPFAIRAGKLRKDNFHHIVHASKETQIR